MREILPYTLTCLTNANSLNEYVLFRGGGGGMGKANIADDVRNIC